MKLFTEALDIETQLLVAVGSAVAAGCVPCLENIVNLASQEQIDSKKLKAAAIIGQFIKDQPATQMKEKADSLLDTHLSSVKSPVKCSLQSENIPAAQETAGGESVETCRCGPGKVNSICC